MDDKSVCEIIIIIIIAIHIMINAQINFLKDNDN